MSIVIRGKSTLSSKKDDELAGILPGNNSLYQSADYSPWFKSGHQPVFINKVLLGLGHTICFQIVVGTCYNIRVVATDTA